MFRNKFRRWSDDSSATELCFREQVNYVERQVSRTIFTFLAIFKTNVCFILSPDFGSSKSDLDCCHNFCSKTICKNDNRGDNHNRRLILELDLGPAKIEVRFSASILQHISLGSSLGLGVFPTRMSAIQSTVVCGRRTNAFSGSSRLRGGAMASQRPVNR